MRKEFVRTADGKYATLAELQAALDAWVQEYNTARPHQSCGGRPPAERFQLAGRNRAAAGPGPVPAPATPPAGTQRPAGVSRWVNAHGKISLGGFSYAAGASYAGEPVEAVVAGGLVDIVHARIAWASTQVPPRRAHIELRPTLTVTTDRLAAPSRILALALGVNRSRSVIEPTDWFTNGPIAGVSDLLSAGRS